MAKPRKNYEREISMETILSQAQTSQDGIPSL
jgi:hypothetical protein